MKLFDFIMLVQNKISKEGKPKYNKNFTSISVETKLICTEQQQANSHMTRKLISFVKLQTDPRVQIQYDNGISIAVNPTLHGLQLYILYIGGGKWFHMAVFGSNQKASQRVGKFWDSKFFCSTLLVPDLLTINSTRGK